MFKVNYFVNFENYTTAFNAANSFIEKRNICLMDYQDKQNIFYDISSEVENGEEISGTTLERLVKHKLETVNHLRALYRLMKSRNYAAKNNDSVCVEKFNVGGWLIGWLAG
ncbi:hypothetical protein GQX74_000385 [Glossina fuscipes]|nr:hypothetical protein GQX74_000385 [Glossina fuscipes]